MQLREYPVGDVDVVALSGRAVQQDADTIRKAIGQLFTSPRKQMVLDMAELTHVDSAALGVLVASQIRAKREGARLKLASPSKRLVEMLSLTRLGTVFEIYDSLDAALASFEDRS